MPGMLCADREHCDCCEQPRCTMLGTESSTWSLTAPHAGNSVMPARGQTAAPVQTPQLGATAATQAQPVEPQPSAPASGSPAVPPQLSGKPQSQADVPAQQLRIQQQQQHQQQQQQRQDQQTGSLPPAAEGSDARQDMPTTVASPQTPQLPSGKLAGLACTWMPACGLTCQMLVLLAIYTSCARLVQACSCSACWHAKNVLALHRARLDQAHKGLHTPVHLLYRGTLSSKLGARPGKAAQGAG